MSKIAFLRAVLLTGENLGIKEDASYSGHFI
jgi:hypothetical protein